MILIKAGLFIIALMLIFTICFFGVIVLVIKVDERLHPRKIIPDKRRTIYKIPWSIYILSTVIYGITLGSIILTVIFVPAWLIVYFHGGPFGAAYSKEIKSIMAVIEGFFFTFLILRRPGWKWLFELENKPIEKWILKNVKCPKCKQSLKNCEKDPTWIHHPLFREAHVWKCYCDNCKEEVKIPSKNISIE